MTDITIYASDKSGRFSAYIAAPNTGARAPTIIVIQEIFGVNANMRAICDSFADKGYIAICPDLFWRQEPGISLTDKTQDEWDKAFELYQGFDVDKGIEDIAATVEVARGQEKGNGRVGAVGYCLGGLLAYLTATRVSVDGSVGYYGVGIQNMLKEANMIKSPLLLHIPTEDQFVDKEAQAKMHTVLDNNSWVTLYDYQGQDHAFAREEGKHYDASAANLANERTLEFFKKNLDT